MTLPSYIGVGTYAVTAVNASIAPSFHASTAAGDLCLLICETNGSTVPNPDSSVWTECPGSPHTSSGGSLPTRITAFWRVAVGGMSAPSVSRNSGNHVMGVIATFRGADPTTPFPVSSVYNSGANNGTWRTPGLTTLTADNMYIGICNTGRDQRAASGTWYLGTGSNASLANYAKRFDEGEDDGDGGSICIVTGEKAAAGVVSDTTGALGNNNGCVIGLGLALAPGAGGGSTSRSFAVMAG